MLAIEPARTGRTYLWDVDQLTSRPSSDVPNRIAWERVLARKRDDWQFSDVAQSLRDSGFIRPLDAWLSPAGVRLSDGHHRLAAAIDAGMRCVPVFLSDTECVSEDSGDWQLGDPVDEEAGQDYDRDAWW